MTETADIDSAVERATISAYGYSGQVCISAQNLFAHESVYDAIRIKLIESTLNTACGDPRLKETVVGPMINESAAERVKRLISEKPLAESNVPTHPCFVAATLIEKPAYDDPIFESEVFGPVLNLIPYANQELLIRELNRGRFRLQASVFARENFDFWANQLQFGGVVWNDAPTVRFDSMPYGGEGESGFGREGVTFATNEMTFLKAVLERKNG